MADIIQVRRDTAANWTSVNPTLAQGEFAVETDTNQFKIGDGVTAWTGLAYVTQGPAATIAVGTTTTGAEGTSASVSNSGNSAAAVFNFTIPRGDTGAQGPQGDAATIAVGTTTTGAEGTNASVVNSGTSGSAVFDFTIPRGDTGATGPQGPQGPQGIQGPQGDPGTPGNLWSLNGLTAEYLAGSIQVGGLVYATGGDSGEWNDAFSWGDHALAGYITGNQTITLSGDLSGSGTTSINAQIAAGVVGANELNVTGNGTTSQYLRSDGDGSFTWATPPDTNTTYSAGRGLDLSGTQFLLETDLRDSISYIGYDSNDYIQWSNNAWCRMVVNGVERVRADTAGLDVSGRIVADGNITAYSDERLKSDVQTLDGTKVFEMRGVSYIKDGELSSGVIAQELQKVAPELVLEGEEYLSVAYGNLVGYLIEAVKDLKAEIEELKNGVTDKRADKS